MTIAKAEAVEAPGAGDIAAAPMAMEVGGAKVPYGRLLRFAWLLVKGSLGSAMGQIVDALAAEHLDAELGRMKRS